MPTPYIFTDEFESELRDTIPTFRSIYEEFQEGKVGFEFDNHKIEISSTYVEKAEPEFIRLLLKTLQQPESEFTLPTHETVKAVAHTWVTGIHGSLNDNPDVKKEQNYAQRSLDKLHMTLDQNPISEGSTAFRLSKLKAKYIKSIMDSFGVEQKENNDPFETNKQGETVYVKNIFHENQKVGALRYIENDSTATILRSDIKPEYQGQGIGKKAYMDFIDEKLSQGKMIHSDCIVSRSAQNVYRALESKGYEVNRQPCRTNHREDLNTLLPDAIRAQQNTFPTKFHEGVRSVEPGFRLKGEPVFKVVKSPNVSLHLDPIQISIYETNKQHETTFNISPNKVNVHEQLGSNLKEVSPSLYDKSEEIFSFIKRSLPHPASQDIHHRLSTENIAIWRINSIERSELEKTIVPAVNFDLQP